MSVIFVVYVELEPIPVRIPDLKFLVSREQREAPIKNMNQICRRRASVVAYAAATIEMLLLPVVIPKVS